MDAKGWQPFLARELREWRQSKVGRAVKAALEASLAAQREACQSAYMEGQAWDEASRQALLRAEELVDDWFEASALDFAQMMGKEEDYLAMMERMNVDG